MRDCATSRPSKPPPLSSAPFPPPGSPHSKQQTPPQPHDQHPRGPTSTPKILPVPHREDSHPARRPQPKSLASARFRRHRLPDASPSTLVPRPHGEQLAIPLEPLAPFPTPPPEQTHLPRCLHHQTHYYRFHEVATAPGGASQKVEWRVISTGYGSSARRSGSSTPPSACIKEPCAAASPPPPSPRSSSPSASTSAARTNGTPVVTVAERRREHA